MTLHAAAASAPTGPVSSDDLREAMARFATGVTILTTLADGRVLAMTANSVASVSLDPPLVLASVAAASRWRLAARAAGAYSIHVLAAQRVELACWGASRERYDEPDRLLAEMRRSDAGLYLPDSLATIHCSIYAEHPAGDHSLLIGEVMATRVARDGKPLLFADRSFGEFMPNRDSRRSRSNPVAFPVDDPFPGWTTPADMQRAS